MFNVPITFNLCCQEENCQTEKETAKIEWLEFATLKEKTEYFLPLFEILDPLKSLFISVVVYVFAANNTLQYFVV